MKITEAPRKFTSNQALSAEEQPQGGIVKKSKGLEETGEDIHAATHRKF